MEMESEENNMHEKKSRRSTKLCTMCKKNLSELTENGEKRKFRKCNECRPIRKLNDEKFIERTCSYCFKVYNGVYYIKKTQANRKRRLKCDECKTINFSKGPQPRPKVDFLQCDLCGDKFNTKNGIYAHMDRHRSDVTCRVCHAHFARRNTLRIHLRTHFENFICELCGYSTINKITFKKHVKMHEDNNMTKPKEKEFKQLAVRGNFPCTYCGSVFQTKTSLIGHEKRRHENGNTGFNCKFCGYTVFRQKEFREHLMTHSSKPLLFCHYPNCDFYHNTVKRINMHVRAVHESRDDSFQCHTCNKLFKHRISLEKHLNNNRCVPLSVRKLNSAKKNISKSTKLIENKTVEELERNAKIAKEQYIEMRGLNKIIEEEKEEEKVVPKKKIKSQTDVVIPKIEPLSDYDDDFTSMNNYSISDHFDHDDDEDDIKIQPFVKIEIKAEPKDHNEIIINDNFDDMMPKMNTNVKCETQNLNPVVLLERLDSTLLIKCSNIKTEIEDFDAMDPDNDDKSQKKKRKYEKKKHKAYCCKYCPEIFSLKQFLKQHERTMHKIEIERSLTEIFTCDMCGKQFNKYMALKVHIKFVHKATSSDFSCPQCPAKFKQNNFLKRHIEEAHNELRKFSCQFCGKTFKRKFHLQDHESRHGNPTTCHICGKLVKNLDKHVKYVHAEKKDLELFPCTFCGRYFNKYVLKSHIKIVHHKIHAAHAVDRPCPKCGEIFKRSEDLKKHDLLTHFVGTIQYCHYPGCDKIFKSIKLLNMHTREVHEKVNEDVSCGACGKLFQSATGLRKHALTKHNIKI